MQKSTSIPQLASAVFDNRRRGNPRPGCDCEQCFGYCLRDNDVAACTRFDNRPVAEVAE